MAVGYYEITITSRPRFKDACFYANGLVWAPSSDGNCDVIDPVTDTPLTPLAIRATGWRCAGLVDDRWIVLVGEVAIGAIVGLIDTSVPGGSYSEPSGLTARGSRNMVVGAGGRAWIAGSGGFLQSFTPASGAWTDAAVALAGNYASGVEHAGSVLFVGAQTQLLEVDASTGAQTPRTIAGATNNARNAAAVSNGKVWASNATTGSTADRILNVDPATWSSSEAVIAGNRNHFIAIAPGAGEVWLPSSGAASLGHIDDTTGAYTQPSVAGITNRVRRGGALVPTAPPLGKIYCPSDGHASCGVFTDIPVPTPPVTRRGVRGVGTMVRGRRG